MCIRDSIEAMRLYRMPPEKISIVVHRESIVHSLVEYCDNAVLAQLGAADMRLPIQYALTWPERTIGPARPLDLLHCPPLTFGMPDCEAFPCLAIACLLYTSRPNRSIGRQMRRLQAPSDPKSRWSGDREPHSDIPPLSLIHI